MDKGETNNALVKKISKLLEGDLEGDKDFLDALKGLSGFFGENTISARRNLRSTLEKRSLHHNEQYLNSLDEVKKIVDSLHSELTSIDSSCQQAMDRLEEIKSRNHKLVRRTNTLKDEWQTARRHQQIVEKFMETFQMRPEEVVILKGPMVMDKSADITIDEQFFQLLQKCRKVHEDSRILLKVNQQTTGMEAMAAMESLEDAAYERLYKWALDCLRSFDPDSENSSVLQEAMKYIAERPILFKHCLNEYGTVRRSIIVRNLIDALTRGSPSGNPPPIDFHSNDPVRYVRDILAWVHQAKASEKGLLDLILQKCDQELKNSTAFISVSFIVESVVRPVKSRIDLVVSSTDSNKSYDPLILFKVKNLIKYYRRVFSEEMSHDSQLVIIMSEIDSLAHRVFINSLNFHCAYKLGRNSDGNYEEPPSDLMPSEWFVKTVYMLEEILSQQNLSFLSPDDMQEETITLANVVVKPLLQACRISASKLPGHEMSIFLLNCYNDIYQVISNRQFADDFKELLKGQIDDYLDSLINENASNIIGYFGLTALYNSIKNEANLPLATITGCDPMALQSCSKKVAAFLTRPDSLQLPQFSSLKSSSLRDEITKKTFQLLCQMYEEIYSAVYKKENEYDEPDSLLPQTPDQFKSILN